MVLKMMRTNVMAAALATLAVAAVVGIGTSEANAAPKKKQTVVASRDGRGVN
ncbi:MAG: hypothetical protein IH582_18570, partial [Afipia sp.]|nr:hypothetical protein [Afipia sp.]